MAEVLTTALSAKFTEGLPEWVDPFMKAVRRMEIVEKRELGAKTLTTSGNPAKTKSKKKKPAKKSKASRKKAAEAIEKDDGLGDEVTDQEMMESAEAYLKTAIELSESTEALPHTWMAVLHMKAEDWTHARESALQAAELEPLCPTILFRLSACYAQEKDYVNAHHYHERGISLLPLPERIAYVAKLDRLKEQSDDVKANVFRADPFEILPVEVILNIMEQGLDDKNPDFVLKASWVNRRWRSILNNSCPELWRTWTITHSALKGELWETKRSAWEKRGGGKMDVISFKNFTLGAVDKIGRTLRWFSFGVKELRIQARDPAVLQRLASWLKPCNLDIQQLRIEGGRLSRRSSPVLPAQAISCDVVQKSCKLHTVELEWVDFQSPDASWNPLASEFRRIDDPEVEPYPNLKRLSVKHCAFNNEYAVPPFDITESHTIKYKVDVIHVALRGAPNLEYLLVKSLWYDRKAPISGVEKRITLSSLKTAILPPASCWSLDIFAPNLESIAYTLPTCFSSKGYEKQNVEEQLPMIPTLNESPVTEESLSKLASAEFVCYTRDDISRLETWVSGMKSLTRLVIGNAVSSPYPKSIPAEDGVANRVSLRALYMLNDNPDWCPALTELEFRGCLTPGKGLVEYVRKRSQRDGCVPLTRLTLDGCSALSERAKTVLEREVELFSVQQERRTYDKQMKKLYMDDDFELDEVHEQE